MSNSFRKYLSNTPGEHKVKELQQTVILNIADIYGEVLIQKCEIFNMGNNITYAQTG
jgi:hypothetical protein